MAELLPEPLSKPRFHPLRIIVPVAVVLLAIALWSQWYAEAISLPRYCADPQAALARLQRILTEPQPAGNEPRRAYIIAAKLMFLLPQRSSESLPDYLSRVAHYLRERCR